MNQSLESSYLQTKAAYVWTRVLDTPFWGLFNLLPIILYKDLQATPFQLALMITLKPLVSILSSYWSHHVQESGKLMKSIILARWCAYLPFLLFPFIESSWYIIFCFGLFMFLQVGMMPTWMELLKKNIPSHHRDKIFSYTQAFGYLGGGLLPFAIGWLLDEWTQAWRWMFPIAALVALTATIWQRLMKAFILKSDSPESNSFHPLFQPWKNAWTLLKKRPDFAKFQIGFMFIGSGLMIIQPALPVFFVDKLHLSYTELGVAITLCKGIGFACSSPLWVRWIQKVDLFYLGSVIASLAAVFTIFLVSAQSEIIWLYFAYLIYGLMQAGNELSWNLSGPIFAKEENSSPFSGINVIAVGVRGMFVPILGGYLLAHFGSLSVICISGCLCILAAIRMALYRYKLNSNDAYSTNA
ncbi:MAG: MFS transporter [Parachlamydiaceae bacterium]|nr:MFS transporter [Parachlamydiaceae bacterium]